MQKDIATSAVRRLVVLANDVVSASTQCHLLAAASPSHCRRSVAFIVIVASQVDTDGPVRYGVQSNLMSEIISAA